MTLQKTKTGAEGHSLDEFQSHRLLEAFGQTMTIVEMRAALKEIDIDTCVVKFSSLFFFSLLVSLSPSLPSLSCL